MIDGIKILNLWVSAEGLLNHPLLTFPLPIDEKTGAVLDERPRRATYRGLTFKITPSRANRSRLVCELKGSLHSYKNDGRHNADDFTAADLLTVVNELVNRFDINPASSTLNNVEFGVNIALPFPVADVLTALISYKGEPFIKDTDNGGIYYQATLSHYAVKIYDKGKQFAIPGYLLRVEVKVLKMQYLTGKGINLTTLADLLQVEQYPRLGKLLSDTVEGILFDDPALTRNPPADIRANDRELLREGRYADFWQRSPGLTGKDYEREKKRLQRQEKRFRDLVNQYRISLDWQTITANRLRIKWQELTQLSNEVETGITETLACWKCPDFTGLSDERINRETLPPPGLTSLDFTGCVKPEMSRFYTLGLGEKRDISPTSDLPGNLDRETVLAGQSAALKLVSHVLGGIEVRNGLAARQNLTEPTIFSSSTNNTLNLLCTTKWRRIGPSVDYCLTTGENITHQKDPHRFVSTVTVKARPILYADLLQKHKRNRRKHNHPEPYYSAHNARNDYTNPANNLRRRLKRLAETPGLFPLSEMLSLTPEQIELLERWRGSPYDVLDRLK